MLGANSWMQCSMLLIFSHCDSLYLWAQHSATLLPSPRSTEASTMPNGHRLPYRLRPDFLIPSPSHTSDSEETRKEKRRWFKLARRVRYRWKRLERLDRYEKFIRVVVFRHKPGLEFAAASVAKFLWVCGKLKSTSTAQPRIIISVMIIRVMYYTRSLVMNILVGN